MIVKETLLFCDGDPGCPMDGPFADGDNRNNNAAEQRHSAGREGWIRRNGKDYCQACAKRLFPPSDIHRGSE